MIKLQIIPEREVSLQVLEPVVKPVIAPKRITENGTYAAKEVGVYGFDPVEVAVDLTPAFEAGQKAEYDRFWDGFQENGNRTNYSFAFGGVGWTDENFQPKYKIRPEGNQSTENMFYCAKITQIPEELLDFSQVKYCYMTFRQAKLVTAPALNLLNCTEGTSWLFGQCYDLKEVRPLTVSEKVTFPNMVMGCSALEKITFAGTIGQELNFQWSPLLTNDSVGSIIDHLKDLTGEATKSLKFHPDVGKRLTEAQKAEITAKNWILVY